MAYLYQEVPPNPSGAELIDLAKRGLAVAESLGAKKPSGILDTVAGWFGGTYGQGAGADARLRQAVIDLQAVIDQCAENPGLAAGGDARERLRRALIVIEQEREGLAWTSTKSASNRAELLDTVANPEAYADAARNLAVGGLDPAGLRTPDSPGLWKQVFPGGFPGWPSLPSGSTVKTVLIVIAVIVALLVVLAVVVRVRTS